MKTSPKTSVALLAIFALGGSTAGSLFSESLQTNVINTVGTAGAFFPDATMQIPNQQAVNVSDDSKSDVEEEVIARPLDVTTQNPAPLAETQVRAITTPEVTQIPIPEPTITPEQSLAPEESIEPSLAPEESIEPSLAPEESIEPPSTPEASPEVSASSAHPTSTP